MNTIYGNIQYIERNDIDIEAVADIAGPMRIVQHMKVISPVILNLFVVLAISKSKENRLEVVKDFLLGLNRTCIDLTDNLLQNLFIIKLTLIYERGWFLYSVYLIFVVITNLSLPLLSLLLLFTV